MLGDLTYGEFVSFTLFLGFMIAPIVQMSNIGINSRSLCWVDRTQELMYTKGKTILMRTQHLKKLNGNAFRTPLPTKPIKPFCTRFPLKQPRKVIALVGSSGSKIDHRWQLLVLIQLAELFLSMNKTFQNKPHSFRQHWVVLQRFPL